MILFSSPALAEMDDLAPILNTSEQPWSSQVNDAEQDRVREIEQRFGKVRIEGRDCESFLCVAIDDLKADTAGIYSRLYIHADGRIATAMTNVPVYYKTLEDLIDAKGFQS